MTEKERADKEALHKYLNRMIDSELDNPEPDMDFISECNAFLDEIEKGECEPDLRIRHDDIKKLYESYRAMHGEKSEKNRTDRMSWSKISIAACICLFILIVPITAGAMNGLTPIELLENIGSKIFSWDSGKKVEIDSMTFIRNGEATEYDSIEDCLNQEQLDIYYPTWLPEGTGIESVVVLPMAKGESILFEFSDKTISFNVNLYQIEYSFSEYNTININDKTAYYILREKEYNGILSDENYQYIVAAPDLDTVINILQGLERTK